MKSLVMTLAILVLAVSCGKNNESGKSGATLNQDSYSYSELEETSLRKDFIKQGKQLLRTYESSIRSLLGQRTVSLIKERLVYSNVQVTGRPLYDDHHHHVRSNNRNALITLYAGREDSDSDWIRSYKKKGPRYLKLVMHELLQLGEVADDNYFYTDRIMGSQHRRHR